MEESTIEVLKKVENAAKIKVDDATYKLAWLKCYQREWHGQRQITLFKFTVEMDLLWNII